MRRTPLTTHYATPPTADNASTSVRNGGLDAKVDRDISRVVGCAPCAGRAGRSTDERRADEDDVFDGGTSRLSICGVDWHVLNCSASRIFPRRRRAVCRAVDPAAWRSG